MNGNEHMNMPYSDNGYSYTTPPPPGFMGFFGGGGQEFPLHYVDVGPVNHQESAYWSMHMSSFRYGPPLSEGSASYYSHYNYGDHHYNPSAMDFNRRAWEYPSMATTAEPVAVDVIPSEENTVSVVHSIADERSSDQEAVSNQVWQDDIDPDNMTYEELLELGEAVGSESRGLSQELIDLLPTSKFKSGGIFSRRKSKERCVICQMRYKRGDKQINLPCKHAYHYDCGSKWLSINKTCPVCNTVVFGAERQH